MTGSGRVLRPLAVALVVAGLAGVPTVAAVLSRTALGGPGPCAGGQPLVLDLGLPRGEADLVPEIREALAALISRAGPPDAGPAAGCPPPDVRVNVALGSNYQVMDWLGQGAIDLALLPELGVELLRSDGIDLVTVIEPAGPPVPVTATVRSYDRAPETPSGWRPRPDPRGDWEEMLTGLVRAAAGADPPCTPLRSACLLLPDHLSNDGFLVPAALAERRLQAYLAARIDEACPPAGREPGARGDDEACRANARKDLEEVRERFWDLLLERTVFTFGAERAAVLDDACGGAGRQAAPTDLVLSVGGDGALAGAGGASGADLPFGGGLGERLVMRRAAAAQAFGPASFAQGEGARGARRTASLLVAAESRLPPGVAALFGAGPATERPSETAWPVPAALDGLVSREPYFGVRTLALTPEETIRLLAVHQGTGTDRLALMLPGGGVKAAYQSRLVDALYGRHLLINRLAAEAEALPSAPAASLSGSGDEDGGLPVDYVIGTSGGALLGFFVARLGPDGPWNLSDILWKRPRAAAEGTDGEAEQQDDLVPLDAADVFGFTDLLRYVSLVTIYLTLAVALGAASMRRGSWLAPPVLRDDHEEDAAGGADRGRRLLVTILLSVLGAAPLLVRAASGDVSLEHVPEFEGLIYAVLVGLAVFADQCMVREREVAGHGDSSDTLWANPVLVVLAGLALVLVALLAAEAPWGGQGPIHRMVSTGFAYLLLGSVSSAIMFMAVRKRELSRRVPAELALWMVSFAGGTVVAFVLLRAIGWALPGVLPALDRTPLLIVGLVLTLVVIGFARLARGTLVVRFEPFRRGVELVGSGTVRFRQSLSSGGPRRAIQLLAPSAVCIAVLDLVRPRADELATVGLAGFAQARSKIDTPLGGLLVCLGVLFVAGGSILVLHHRRNRYRLQGIDRFVDGVVFVVVGLAFAVYLMLWLLSQLSGGGFTLFELTTGFWLALIVVSVLDSWIVLAWARSATPEEPFSSWLRGALDYLCSRHPNGLLVARRFIRIALYAVGALVWWNLVLAPGLYGNRYAKDYLRTADERFQKELARVEPEAEPPYGLTAQLLAPANALEVDGTRFILAVPEQIDCRTLPRGEGVTWYQLHVVRGRAPGGRAPERSAACESLDLGGPDGLELLRSFVFASGSPFPVFPATRPAASWTGRREALVDGGYSNNVPVQAADELDADQVLIVHSSSPVPAPAGPPGLLSQVTGPLVENVPRLVGFLYERSQQLDRRSRGDLFVASLAPPQRSWWPPLTDFRASTVESMLRTAEQDLHRRIGRVESWGLPEFETSFTLSPGS